MKPEFVDEWQQDFSGYGGPLPELLNVVERRLESEPDLEPELIDAATRRLSDGVDGETINTLANAFDALGFERLDALVAWAVRIGAPLLDDLEAEGSAPRLTRLLRRLVAMNEPELQRAVGVMGKPAKDWRRFRREIYLDVEAEQYAIKLEIERFDGETFSIEGDEQSLLLLTGNLVDALRVFSKPEVFADADREPFIDSLHALVASLRAPDDAEDGAVRESETQPATG